MSGGVGEVRSPARPERRIPKPPGGWAVEPNLLDYDAARARFRWEDEAKALQGLPGGSGLNIAHEALDRHAAGPRAERTALRWRGRHGERRDLSFRQLSRLTSRFANALDALGVRPGERVFTLAGRIPELYLAALGAMKHGSVYAPLFPAFGPGSWASGAWCSARSWWTVRCRPGRRSRSPSRGITARATGTGAASS